jgi:hypothetical protein
VPKPTASLRELRYYLPSYKFSLVNLAFFMSDQITNILVVLTAVPRLVPF